jgi:hypothetical protein
LENRNRSHHRKYQSIIRTKKGRNRKKKEGDREPITGASSALQGLAGYLPCRRVAQPSRGEGARSWILASVDAWVVYSSITDRWGLFILDPTTSKRETLDLEASYDCSTPWCALLFLALHASSGGCSILRHTLFFQRLLISLLARWFTVSVVPRTATKDSRAKRARGRDCWSAGPHDPRPCVPIPWLSRFQATPCGGRGLSNFAL